MNQEIRILWSVKPCLGNRIRILIDPNDLLGVSSQAPGMSPWSTAEIKKEWKFGWWQVTQDEGSFRIAIFAGEWIQEDGIPGG
jgi:hypothetical protein